MNELIQNIFQNFEIPISFLHYKGKSTTYITYQQVSIDNSFSGDNEILGFVVYYDFDIYSKGNYFAVVEAVKQLLESNGFRWQPTMSSGDIYEEETGYYHKTLCFAIEREVLRNG